MKLHLAKIVALLATANVTAQTGGFFESYDYGTTHGQLYTSFENGPELIWKSVTPQGATVVSSSMPFDVPRECVEVSQNRFLLSGVDSTLGTGRLVIVFLDTTNELIVTEVAQDYSGREFIALYVNSSEQRVYAHDVTSSSIVYFPVPTGATLPQPSQFTLAVDSVLAPVLSAPYRRALLLGEPPQGSSFSFSLFGVWSEGGDTWAASESGGVWQVVATGGFTPVTRWEFEHPFMNSNGPVGVGGAIGSFVVRAADDGTSVAAGTHTDTAFHEVSIPPGSIVPGKPYFIESATPGVGDSPTRVFTSRYGLSGSVLGDEGTVRLLPGDPILGCHSSNSQFGVGGRLSWADTDSDHVATYDAYVWIAVEPSGTTPVAFLPNGAAVLSNIVASIGPIPTEIRGKLHGHIRHELPLGSGMEGLVLYFQFAAVVGSNVIVSDAFGSTVLPDPAASSQAQSSQSTAQPLPVLSESIESKRRRAVRWLQSDPDRCIDKYERLLIHCATGLAPLHAPVPEELR